MVLRSLYIRIRKRYLTSENIDALLTYIESKNIEIVTSNKAVQDFYTITWDDFNSLRKLIARLNNA